jgi:HSP20 family molecular chaperone IbpA
MLQDFDLIWKNWSRPITEVTGWVSTKTKDGYVILANTIGVSKDDIKVDFEGNYLTLSGKTEIMGGFFTTANYRWNIKNLKNDIDNIDYLVKDGFTYIYIVTKEDTRPNIKISYRN